MPHEVHIDPEVQSVVELALSGQHDAARQGFEALWQQLPPDDAFHRCVVAHYMADLQTTPEDELRWDQWALDAALQGAPDTFNDRIPDVTYESFLPSLYLNLAASHERVGQRAAANSSALAALRIVQGAAATPLGAMTRSAIVRICQRLGVDLQGLASARALRQRRQVQ